MPSANKDTAEVILFDPDQSGKMELQSEHRRIWRNLETSQNPRLCLQGLQLAGGVLDEMVFY